MSWNPYIYVKQNPVNAADPSGRDALFDYTSLLENESWKSALEMRAAAYQVRVALCIEDYLLAWIEFGIGGSVDAMTAADYLEARNLC